MTVDAMTVMLEFGPKGKRVVAVARDWPGLERGAKTEEAAIGRDRDQIVRHVVSNEQQWAKKLGVLSADAAIQTEDGLKAHRDPLCSAIRAFHAQGQMARTWPLRYLIRHTAYHALDHTWEMEDRDLGAISPERSGP